MPRYAVLVKASPESEAGVMPSQQELEDMGAFNQELVAAGAMRAGEGLHPSSKGALVTFDRGAPTVVDGPFVEAKELVAGFWILELDSLEDATDWIKRAPFVDADIEIRRVYETGELTAQLKGAA